MTILTKGPVNHLTAPLFFGKEQGIARYETMKYPEFDKLTEKLLGFFWVPQHVKMGPDRINYDAFEDHERHIYDSTLSYQIVMDTVQGRGPSEILAPIISLPEVGNYAHTWNFSETIHNRSYTHMLRALYDNPSILFDKVMKNKAILARAEQVTKYYDKLAAFNNVRAVMDGDDVGHPLLDRIGGFTMGAQMREQFDDAHMDALILCLHSVNALEAIRFYGSFACTFLFAKNGRMEGSATLMRYIARDEAIHHSGTNLMHGLLRDGDEGPRWQAAWHRNREEGIEIFRETVNQELDWAEELFKFKPMLGMNATNLGQYIKFSGNKRMGAIGLPALWPEVKTDPFPWMREYITSDSTQGTPQEAEESRYLQNAVGMEMSASDLANLNFD